MSSLNDKVCDFWEKEACGTSSSVVKENKKFSKDYFEAIEKSRYSYEPFIHSIAQFSRHKGKKVLEIGVGAGTDHLQWARVGTELYGIDLTEKAISMTQKRLNLYGEKSNLIIHDAESLPFENNKFDVVYSWGVIHHSEHPEKIFEEILRVLKDDGEFIGMLYHKFSLTAFQTWIKFALFRGNPFRSFSEVIYNHFESIGTKAYTKKELKILLSDFRKLEIIPILTEGDKYKLPNFIKMFIPSRLGWYWAIKAVK